MNDEDMAMNHNNDESNNDSDFSSVVGHTKKDNATDIIEVDNESEDDEFHDYASNQSNGDPLFVG